LFRALRFRFRSALRDAGRRLHPRREMAPFDDRTRDPPSRPDLSDARHARRGDAAALRPDLGRSPRPQRSRERPSLTPLAAGLTPATALILFLAAVGGSTIGSMAGGGTLVTFSTLILLGMPGIMANATSTVGLLPTGAAGVVGHREEMRAHRPWIAALL